VTARSVDCLTQFTCAFRTRRFDDTKLNESIGRLVCILDQLNLPHRTHNKPHLTHYNIITYAAYTS
jgi:hypothetical protein